jgi:hypothetical protein
MGQQHVITRPYRGTTGCKRGEGGGAAGATGTGRNDGLLMVAGALRVLARGGRVGPETLGTRGRFGLGAEPSLRIGEGRAGRSSR